MVTSFKTSVVIIDPLLVQTPGYTYHQWIRIFNKNQTRPNNFNDRVKTKKYSQIFFFNTSIIGTMRGPCKNEIILFFKTLQQTKKPFQKYCINDKINLDTLAHEKKSSVVFDLIFVITLRIYIILNIMELSCFSTRRIFIILYSLFLHSPELSGFCWRKQTRQLDFHYITSTDGRS